MGTNRVQTPSAPFGMLARGMLPAVPDRNSLGCLTGYARAEKDHRKYKSWLFSSVKRGLRWLQKRWALGRLPPAYAQALIVVSYWCANLSNITRRNFYSSQ